MSTRSLVTVGIVGIMLPGMVVLVAGCPRGQVPEVDQGPTTQQLIDYYSPRTIKICPFTKPASFDDDAIPDGIGVFLEPRDGAGDTGKAYGTFIFELYSYRPAAGSRRGQLIQRWTQPVVSLEQQEQFWNHVIRMYEFQLSWEGEPIPPQQKYILAASFQAPGSERLFDEYEFEFRVHRDEILNALAEPE